MSAPDDPTRPSLDERDAETQAAFDALRIRVRAFADEGSRLEASQRALLKHARFASELAKKLKGIAMGDSPRIHPALAQGHDEYRRQAEVLREETEAVARLREVTLALAAAYRLESRDVGAETSNEPSFREFSQEFFGNARKRYEGTREWFDAEWRRWSPEAPTAAETPDLETILDVLPDPEAEPEAGDIGDLE